jgi:hypothetical protein
MHLHFSRQIGIMATTCIILSLEMTSCELAGSRPSGARLQEAAIQGAAGQKYSYTKSLFYDVSKKRYVMSGMAKSEVGFPNAEPPAIYNSFKCYFVRSNGRWRAKPAKRGEADSTLVSGELLIDNATNRCLVADAELAPFYTYCPAIDPNGPILLGHEVEVVVFDQRKLQRHPDSKERTSRHGDKPSN